MKTTLMKCFVCARSPEIVGTLYRVGAKGVEANWACSSHVPEQYKPDPEVVMIASIIESSQQSHH